MFLLSFDCRLSWEGGFEQVDPRTGSKPQTRNAVIFVHNITGVTFMRGDQIVVDQFPGRRLEIEFNRLIWDGDQPHHWELSAVQIEGN